MSTLLATLMAAKPQPKAEAEPPREEYKTPTVRVNPDPAEKPVQVNAPVAPDQIAEDVAAMGVTPPPAPAPRTLPDAHGCSFAADIKAAVAALEAAGLVQVDADCVLAYLLGKLG